LVPIDKIRKAAIDAHIPLIEEAGPSQDAHWYDTAEGVPGPTMEAPWNIGNFLAVGSEEKHELVVAETSRSMAERLP
jgi:hypothetical protein